MPVDARSIVGRFLPASVKRREGKRPGAGEDYRQARLFTLKSLFAGITFFNAIIVDVSSITARADGLKRRPMVADLYRHDESRFVSVTAPAFDSDQTVYQAR